MYVAPCRHYKSYTVLNLLATIVMIIKLMILVGSHMDRGLNSSLRDTYIYVAMHTIVF